MSLIEKAAIMIGKKSRENLNIDSEREEIIVYGAINLMQTINSIIWVAIFGILTDTLYESLTFSISACILRKYSGGGHASSPMRCAIIGALTAVVSGILIDRFLYNMSYKLFILLSLIIVIISLLIIIRKAPVDSIEKPIRNELKKIFKVKSIIVILIYSVVISSLIIVSQIYSEVVFKKISECILLGTLWQCTTLTEFGRKMIVGMDSILKVLRKERKNA